MRVWEVTLIIHGAVKIERLIRFKTDKELQFNNLFRSEITIKNSRNHQGLEITSTVFTETSERAYKVALLFIGKMLDVLSLKTNISLFVLEDYNRLKVRDDNVLAIISKAEFKRCFELSRDLNLNQPYYLRGLNWFRKGLYTSDPFDKFFALWNSISVVGEHYYNRDNERANNGGSINRIWNCFERLWGQNFTQFEIVRITQDAEGNDINNRWINIKNNLRNDIAHGAITIDVETINRVLSHLEETEQVAKKFLIDLGQLQLNINITQHNEA